MSFQAWRRAATIWLVSAMGIAAVALLTVASGERAELRALFAFTFPERDGWTDLGSVLAKNGTLATAALVLASRAPSRTFATAVILVWTLNVGLAGAALGAYGEPLVRHAALYGSFELAGFSVVLARCLPGRRADRPGGELLVAAALLLMAALTETVLHWRP